MVDPHNLNYGHFGTATYDLDDSEWAFRRNDERQRLTQLGRWRTVVPAAIHFPAPASSRPAPAVYDAVKALVRACPDLAPAGELLPELEVVSAAVTAATSTYDALQGDLLSFGSVTCHGQPNHRPKRVVATATGEVGNILRLQVLSQDRYGWGEERRGSWVQGPSVAGGEGGYWNDEAAPIQQICFAQTEDRSAFLAVRLPTRSVLFRPTFLHRRKNTRSEYFHLPLSDIDARPILSITQEESGGVPHAHVAFNPDYQRQVGIVNQKGNWSIWDMDGHHSGEYSAACSAQGSVVPKDESTELDAKEVAVKEDGWATIMWVGDANTIVVANRRHLTVFNFKHASTLKCPNLISPKSADWILDVVRHSSNTKLAFVLTSTHLFLLLVTCPSDDFGDDTIDAGATVLVSCTHFRGTDDVTLQLCVHESGDGHCFVVIHSRLNQLATVYWFKEHSSSRLSTGSGSVSVSDPICMHLQQADSFHHIRQMYMDRLSFGAPVGRHAHAINNVYEEQGAQFHRISLLLSDLSIREILLYTYDGDRKPSHLQIPPTVWIRTVRSKPCTGQSLASMTDVVDDFLVPDGVIDTQTLCLKRPHELPHWTRHRKTPAPWYHRDYSSLHEALVDATPADSNSPSLAVETIDINYVVKELMQLLAGNSTLIKPPLGTLLEYAGIAITVSDIDEASAKLQDMFSSEVGDDVMELQKIAADHVLALAEAATPEQLTVLSVYDTILQNWIAPLPPSVSARVRQHKERLARRVAVEVMLATTRVRYHDEALPANDAHPVPSQDSGIAFPNISSQPIFSQAGSSQLQFTMPVIEEAPLPSPTISQSVSDPLSRLSKHLRIEKPLPPSLPPGISQVLTHWQLGTDPSTYSWEATESAYQDELESQDEASQARRKKAQRKKERQEKRQKREDELFKHRTESQPDMPRSSPGPTLGMGGMGSSSQIPSQSQSQSWGLPFPGMVMQSQAEPGKHGSRPKAVKKKKNRKISSDVHYTSKTTATMSDFPSLQPAFTVRVDIDSPMAVGGQAGSDLVVVPMVSGTVKTEAGFEPELDAQLHGVGYDYIRNDVNGENMRLDVRSQVKNNDGTILAMYYKGTVALNAAVKAILSGSSDAKTTEYGDSFVTFTFETGSEKYKELQNGTYVAAGHFVKDGGKGTVVEYKVSKVIKG
ncbi:hypothetical protein P280DRAFT_442819 [Massarina eburnea CBS 473.64]|uniref:RNA polymerase I-specific transcription initiation factor RRN6-like protein n=1 Tax=Massarina eburnea CBS 473.64 TaxID=1395130 RepID=A0A6A6SDA7_9PLEO|nr:hypothetical protein P280DRAFT_442819 [Massarina eburnea CBS 473.64]